MHVITRLATLLLLLLFLGNGADLAAQPTAPSTRDLAPGLIVPEQARPGPGFDVDAATQSYVELLTPEQRAQSDAYFEGGYWILLWEGVVTVLVAAILLFSGLSRRLRDWSQRLGRWQFVHTALYIAMFLAVVYVLMLPFSVYVSFWREHQYGLATQSFGLWFSESLIDLGISMLMGAPIIALMYAAVRRAGAAWWAWAGAISVAGLLFMIMIAPVFVAPLFNTYKPMPEGELRDSVLAMARAHRIPAENVYVFDASKQTTRISANVSGLFGTTRIALNDNLMERTSDQEIRAVMGHEMGHYVLNHAIRLVIYIGLVLTLGYLFVHLSFEAVLTRFGSKWGVKGRGDPAGLPLAMALLTVFLTTAQPVVNSIIRSAEAEADTFGLAAAGEPHGFATAAMRLSTYRKIHPGSWEEVIFYDHPSGYDRVLGSMSYLREHQGDPRVQTAVAAGRPRAAP